jgi:hypothetical protein
MGRRLDRSHESSILPRNGVLPGYAQRVQPEAYPSDTGRVDAGFTLPVLRGSLDRQRRLSVQVGIDDLHHP